MIGKSGKHYNNPNVARMMGDAPEESSVEAGGEPHEDTVVEVHKTPEGYKSKHGGDEREHAQFADLVEHLREALGAEGDGDADDAGTHGHEAALKSAAKSAAKPMNGPANSGGLTALSSL